MKIPINDHIPLMQYFPLPDEYLTVHISSLSVYATEQVTQHQLTRLFNSLQRGDCLTLGHVLTHTKSELFQYRNLGKNTLKLLMNLLNLASLCPEKLLRSPIMRTPTNRSLKQLDRKADVINRLRQNYTAKILDTPEKIESFRRQEEIKEKLRSMGMIT